VNVKNKVQYINTLDQEKKPKKFAVDQTEPTEIIFEGKNPQLIVGDNLFKIFHYGTMSTKMIFRFALNPAFLPERVGEKSVFKLGIRELDPDSLPKDDDFPKDFSIELHMKILSKVPDRDDPNFPLMMKFYG
jgi:hypothetical protein